MTGDEWQFAGVALAAAIGGSGVVGLFSGGIELSRRARLRRAIEKAADLIERLDDESAEAGSLRHARRLDTLRLAALSVIGLPAVLGRMVALVVLVLVLYVFGFVAVAWVAPDMFGWVFKGLQDRQVGAIFLGMVVFAMFYAGAFFWLLDQTLRQRRTQYVLAVDEGMDVRVAATAYGSRRRELSGLAVERYQRALEASDPFEELRKTQKTGPVRAKPRRSRRRGGASQS